MILIVTWATRDLVRALFTDAFRRDCTLVFVIQGPPLAHAGRIAIFSCGIMPTTFISIEYDGVVTDGCSNSESFDVSQDIRKAKL